MKVLTISNKTFLICKNEIIKTKNADKAHENICAKLNLYGVKYFGHGTPYQKRKVELIWRNILFILIEFKEFASITTSEEKSQIKQYLNIKSV